MPFDLQHLPGTATAARTARDHRAARGPDGAQRLRDRRDDPGAARHRAVAQRRARERPAAGRRRLFPRLRRRPSFCGARSPTASGASRSSPPESRSTSCSPCCARSPGSFPLLIAGRVAMGASAAVTRVLVVAMVRDLFEGEAMARIMSLVFMVFMVVPVLAPSIGQLILLVAPWRAIFLVLAVYGAGDARLVLAPAAGDAASRISPKPRTRRDPARGRRRPRSEPLSSGYTLALTAIFGGAGRLYQLDPADRLRSVRLARDHRARLRSDRRADGACVLDQRAGRRPVRPAPRRPRRDGRIRRRRLRASDRDGCGAGEPCGCSSSCRR